MNPEIARQLRPLLLGAVMVLLLLGPVVAGDSKDQASEKKPAESSEKAGAKKAPAAEPDKKPASPEVEVYTNEDLERLFAGEKSETGEADPSAEDPRQAATPATQPTPSAPEPGEAAAPGPVDPAAWLAARKAKAEERQRLIEEAQAKVDGLRVRIADLEKRRLATRNPLLPRPDIPEEEREEWNKVGAAQRVSATERQLDEARRELQLAERELARARSAS